MNRHLSLSVLALAVTLGACGRDSTAPSAPVAVDGISAAQTSAAGVYVVTSTADAGPGSLREGLVRASTDTTIGVIRFTWQLPPVALASPVVYSGRQALTIQGAYGHVVGPSCARCDAIIATGDADLTLEQLTIRDAGGSGVSVRVSAAATGTIDVVLRQVVLLDNGLHGIVIDDQAPDPNAPPDPNDPVPYGHDSDASINFAAITCKVAGNGFGGPNDFDGIRVDEGGVGDITARLSNTTLASNGADGIELDERGIGTARLSGILNEIEGNGANNPADPDDAIDIDEAGPGDIDVRLFKTRARGSRDEGYDFTEADAGDVRLYLENVRAENNVDEGIKVEESGDGSIDAEFVYGSVQFTRGADGIQLSENDDGNLIVRWLGETSRKNAGAGLKLEESGNGDLHMTMDRGSIGFNQGAGIDADEDDAGTGTIVLIAGGVHGNQGGNFVLDDVVIIAK